MARIITLATIKGGTGKTTTAAALIHAAERDGKKVLAVDLDPQANLTYIMQADAGGALDAMRGADIADCLQTVTPRIDILAASADLSTLKSRKGSAYRLARSLRTVKRYYDFIIVDTPPQYGELVTNALTAATDLLIPVTTDAGSVQGLYKIIETARYVKEVSNPDLSFTGVFVANYDRRPTINRHLAQLIKDAADKAGIPFLSPIRRGCAVSEAAAFRKSLFGYAPKSKQAADYMQLYREVITK